MALINLSLTSTAMPKRRLRFINRYLAESLQRLFVSKDLANLNHISKKEESKIMHILLPIGKSSMLMANECSGYYGREQTGENRSKIVIGTESKEEADKLFNGLSSGRTNREGLLCDSPWGGSHHILVVSETNTVLNGSWNLIQK